MSETVGHSPEKNAKLGEESYLDKLFARLEAEGNIIPVSQEAVDALNEDIRRRMEEYKGELLERLRQSGDSTVYLTF